MRSATAFLPLVISTLTKFASQDVAKFVNVLMLSGKLDWLSIPTALFIGTIGAVSVVKAVYIDKRDIKCACVGGASKVPLGFVSLTENVMMVGMALWMVAMR